MSSKKSRKIAVCTIDSYTATMRQMEKFNPYQTGHGVYQSKRHPKRSARKEEFRKICNAEF